MYITIKRKDSVSSILLFIFNVFLVQRGITAIPLKKIFQILEPFQKNETAIRMGLSREIQNGLLINKKDRGEVFYHLTATAIEGFKYWMKTMDYDHERLQTQLNEWHGIWSIIAITEQTGNPAPELSQNLQANSYGLLNKTTWISPYNRPEFIQQLLAKHSLGQKLYAFETRLSSTTPQELASSVWPIAELNQCYHRFYDALEHDNAGLDLNSFNGGGGLPFLYHYGLEFFEIIQDDPRLPLSILPDNWQGLKAGKAFQSFRERVFPQVNAFVQQIIESGR